jgi:molecular chaperone DnaK
VPQIEVSFEVDVNGIVSVSAQDKATGSEQQMRISPTSGLTPEEIDRLIREAESFAEADRNTKEMLVLKTRLDSLLKNTEKSFSKFGGLLEEVEQESAERVFVDAKAALKTDKADDIRIATSKLERVAAQLTSAMLNPSADVAKSE